MKPYPPVLKEKKRYVLFEVVSDTQGFRIITELLDALLSRRSDNGGVPFPIRIFSLRFQKIRTGPSNRADPLLVAVLQCLVIP